MYSDDEDDEENHDNGEGTNAEAPEGEQRKKRSSSRELHMYTEEELAVFKKRELVADEQLLDGLSPPCVLSSSQY